jgi:antitoxin (DNA-binding transcriptional repressor) of toxin-antitoxin stability system
VATGGSLIVMTTVSIHETKTRMTELARRVDRGERITITRNGKPVLERVPRTQKGGIDYAAGDLWLKSRGMSRPLVWVSDDCDDPLLADFLLRPLPEMK